jgi:hypothetical protein
LRLGFPVRCALCEVLILRMNGVNRERGAEGKLQA